MHTATLKSGEWCASKAAPRPGQSAFRWALCSRRGPGPAEGAGRGWAWTAGKTLGLKKTLPRQTQIQVHGKKKVGRELKPEIPGQPSIRPSCPDAGDTCGCPADAWCPDSLFSCPHLPLVQGCSLEGNAKDADCPLPFARDGWRAGLGHGGEVGVEGFSGSSFSESFFPLILLHLICL